MVCPCSSAPGSLSRSSTAMSSRASSAREKEDQVVRLRLAGMGFDAIARQVGYRDRSGAWKAYKKALDRRTVVDENHSREDDVNLELARLDELQSRIWARAMRGDLAAFDRVLKVMAQRDKLKHRYHAPAAKKEGATPTADGVVVGPDKLDEMREKRRAGQ